MSISVDIQVDQDARCVAGPFSDCRGEGSKSSTCRSTIYRTRAREFPQNWAFQLYDKRFRRIGCSSKEACIASKRPMGKVSSLRSGVSKSAVFPMFLGLLMLSLANGRNIGYTNKKTGDSVILFTIQRSSENPCVAGSIPALTTEGND
jgi:hypothetical protein